MLLLLLRNRIIPLIFGCFTLAALSTESKAQSKVVADRIDQFVRSKMSKSLVPGMSLAVVYQDSILLSRGYGKTSANAPVTSETLFPIASLSKAFTATAILQLVEEGKIGLDEPVSKYIPSLKINDELAKRITISQLLNQTSGLSDKGFSEFTADKEPASQDEFISQMEKARVISNPGEKFQYHNPNFRLLAAVVESVSETRFSDYLNLHVFMPAGMNHTFGSSSTSQFYKGNESAKQGHIFCLGKPIAIEDPEWFVDGAAGIVSTADDMARWLMVQMNNGKSGNTTIITEHSLTAMWSRPENVQSRYGMGWFVRPDSSLYHSGILWTYSAEAIVDVKKEYGVIMMFNGGINPFVDYYSFLQGVDDILNEKDPEISSIPDWIFPACLFVIFLILCALVLRSIFSTRQWKIKYEHRARWRSLLYTGLRILPFALLVSLPLILTSVSGRVLSGYRIFLMAPDIIIELLIFSLLNLFLIGKRLFILFR